MKYASLLFIMLFGMSLNAAAQDSYHTTLLNRLQTNYNLPAGAWQFGNTEAEVYAQGNGYGIAISDASIANQDFATELRLEVPQVGGNPWDAGYTIANEQMIQQGDKVFWVFYLRSEGGSGRVNLFVERTFDFAKEVFFSAPIDINWKRYQVSFETTYGPHAPGSLNFGFHLAYQQQDVRVGGFTAMNFGSAIDLDDLPSDLNNDNYGGHEPDAAWRAPADARIDDLRKANLTIRAIDGRGNLTENVDVYIQQIEHEFAFGTAVKACRLANNNCADATYQDKLTNLDGRGHGFNWVVFENDLKWDGWEEMWYVDNPSVAEAATWLRNRNIGLRGHALLWPGADNLPNDVAANPADTAFVLNRIRGHIDELANYPGLADDIRDWDVINETVTNTTLENAFRGQGQYTTGRELYGQVFAKARQAFPQSKLYLNDYVTLTLGNSAGAAPYDALKRNLGELLDSGAPVDGIGFQGHIGSQLNGIPSVLATFDDFYDAYELEAKVTEFDLPPLVNDSLAAKYLGDMLTATFSHPSMTGFFFWNFWDTDTWQNPSANMFAADWTPKPALQAFNDKVFGEWWTEEFITTAANGEANIRAFKGRYAVAYACGDIVMNDTLQLAEDMEITLECFEFTRTTETLPQDAISVYPNPSAGDFFIDSSLPQRAEGVLYNVLGSEVWRGVIEPGVRQLTLKLTAGKYNLKVDFKGRISTKAVCVE